MKRAIARIGLGASLLLVPVALGCGTRLSGPPTVNLRYEKPARQPGHLTQSEWLAEQFGWIRDF